MPKALRYTQYDHLDFPPYEYKPYPRALKPPDRPQRMAAAKEELTLAAKIENKEQREAAMELARKAIEAAYHYHVRVESAEEEKEVRAKWAAEAKGKTA